MSETHPTAIRRVLQCVERRYVEPARFAAESMLDGAYAAAAVLLDPLDSPPMQATPPAGGGLTDRLAPPLEHALGSFARDVDGPTRERLQAALLNGALARLDRFSRVATGGSRRLWTHRLAGTTGAVGLRIGRREGQLRILACLAGGAAVDSELRAGDRLVGLDGQPVGDRRVGDVLARLRGPVGQAVEIEVERLDRPVRVVRRPFGLPTVDGSRLETGRAWLRIRRLTRRTAVQLDGCLERLTRERPLVGLVLDLRGNQGGSMLGAAAVADRFIDRGVLAEALDREGRPVPGLRSRVEARPCDRPAPRIVVLVDRRTASSAELLAAALAWHGRARLAGERTFGKNFVQKLYPDDEADLTLKLSVAYVGTAGRRLPAGGLAPDVGIDLRAAPRKSPAADDDAVRTCLALLRS